MSVGGIKMRLISCYLTVLFVLLMAGFAEALVDPPCNSTVSEDVVLTHDMACSDNGIIINGTNITVDCQGHAIIGIGSPEKGIVSSVYYTGGRRDENVRITSCTIKNFGIGIYLASSNSSIVENSYFENNSMALTTGEVPLVILRNNTFNTTLNYGAYLNYHSNIIVEGNTFLNMQTGNYPAALDIQGGSGTYIIRNNLFDSIAGYSITINSNMRGNIINNTFINNKNSNPSINVPMINVQNTWGLNLSQNHGQNNRANIVLLGDKIYVISNEMHDNGSYMQVKGYRHVVEGNVLDNINLTIGDSTYGCYQCIVDNNQITGNLVFFYATYTNATNNTVSGEITFKQNSVYNNLKGNTMGGLTLDYASNYNTIEYGTINGPVFFIGHYGDSITQNVLRNNYIAGMVSLDGGMNTYGVFGNEISYNEIHGGVYINTNDGYKGENSVIGNNITGPSKVVELGTTGHNSIRDNHISGGLYGIYLAMGARANSIANNVITGTSEAGVYMEHSNSDNHINENAVSGAKYGIYFGFSSYNSVAWRNNATNNQYGIYIASAAGSNIRIYENNLSNNDYGLFTGRYDEQNKIYSNHITNNAAAGLQIQSDNNQIYDNYFDNLVNVIALHINGTPTNNTWYKTPDYHIITNILGGPKQGGNYWSDYSGADSNGDGFGESPYTNGPVNDLYPLVQRANYAPIISYFSDYWLDVGFESTISGLLYDDHPEMLVVTTNAFSELNGNVSINQSNVEIKITPAPSDAGVHNISVNVSDGEFTVINSFLLHINTPPVITPLPVQEFKEGDVVNFTINATDADNDTLTYSTNAWMVLGYSPLPYTFNTTTGLFEWPTDYNDSGTYNLTFYAYDGRISSHINVIVIVHDAPCLSPLDYTDANGTNISDQQHTISDAVKFTEYYLSNNPLADVNGDGVVNLEDKLCAKKYYSSGLYECPLNCTIYTPYKPRIEMGADRLR